MSGKVIGESVNDICTTAKLQHRGKCPESLVKYLKDDTNSFKDRNTAIWALGQLGEESALETLEGYYTGEIPEREPLDEALSQHEIKKAINLINSGFNITAFLWRR